MSRAVLIAREAWRPVPPRRVAALPHFGLSRHLPFAGGHREAAIPVPIPNTEVKRLIAEGSAGPARARVGRRRLLFLSRGAVARWSCGPGRRDRETRNQKRETRNAKPETAKPEARALDFELQTLNSKQQTHEQTLEHGDRPVGWSFNGDQRFALWSGCSC